VAELPKIIPIFPLPNLVLFPGVVVPLHIFEPRYREMVEHVNESHGLIGMVLLKDMGESDYYKNPDLYQNPDIYSIGCAGRVTNLSRMPDGRYNLALTGLSEFRVAREIRERSYRQAEANWRPVAPEQLEMDSEAMEGLRQLLFDYLGDMAAQAWHSVVEERGLRGASLINFLCFHLDITPIEKQTLLEAGDGRVDCLFDVISFKLEERRQGGSGPAGNTTVQ
jgi:uncharacterized protein